MMNIDFSFICTECGREISNTVYCPEPNYMAEKNSDSYTEDDDSVGCENCGKEYEYSVTNTFGGANLAVDFGKVKVTFGEPYYDDDDFDEWCHSMWVDNLPVHYKTLNDHLDSAYELLEIAVNDKTRFSLNVMIFGHVVAAIEGFLSSVFIKTTIEHEELIRKLVKKDPQLSKRTFTMSELFEKRDQVKDIVAQYLYELIFHDLKKIKPMYNQVLGHDFGDIGWLFKAVKKRHDCVHRAGYDKEGNPIQFADGEIPDLIKNIRILAKSVNDTVEKLELELYACKDLYSR